MIGGLSKTDKSKRPPNVYPKRRGCVVVEYEGMSILSTAPFSHTRLLSVGSIIAIISYFENEAISTIGTILYML